nr:zinc finger, CCHC-type [Tanacetum cinerariifolium]
MHFLLSSMSVVYVLTTPSSEDGGNDATVEQILKRAKWDNDDYICRGLILNGISDSLFDIYQNIESSKELWDSLESKYMFEDASSKKFLESLRVQDSNKPKGNNVVGLSVVNMVDHNNSSRYNDNKGKRKHHDNTKANLNKKHKVTCWKCRKHRHLRKDCKGGKVGNKANGLGIKGLVDGSSNSLKGNKKHFVTFIDDALRFCYVYLLHSKDEALDKFKVFKIEVELQQGSLIKIFKTNRGGTKDEVSDQYSYCFNVDDDSKTFDEAMNSQDVAFWKEAINDEMDFIMGEADVVLGMRFKHESNGISICQSHYIKKVVKKFNYFDCTPVSTPIDTSKKLMLNKGKVVSQLKYSRVISYLMYAMTCTRPDIDFLVGKMSRYASNPGTQHWQAIQRASKKQTCITGSRMKSEHVALADASKEAEWLKTLLLKIPLWSKPIARIFIRCDSASTLAKAYSQMYNGKSRHLGVSGLKHMYLHIILRMCLEPAKKEDEVFTSQWSF